MPLATKTPVEKSAGRRKTTSGKGADVLPFTTGGKTPKPVKKPPVVKGRKRNADNDAPAHIPGHEWRKNGAGFNLFRVWWEFDPSVGKKRRRRKYVTYCGIRALEILREAGYETTNRRSG